MLNNSRKSAGTLVLLIIIDRNTLAIPTGHSVVVRRVKVICFVGSHHNFIITTFAFVPADLRSAGIEYKDLLIRLLPMWHYIITLYQTLANVGSDCK